MNQTSQNSTIFVTIDFTMNYYKLLRLNSLVKSDRMKILGVGVLFTLRKRFHNVFFDPILLCNFRCKMCYFSDPEYKPSKKRFAEEDLPKIASAFFSNALKLQIGCGAEPSLYKYNEKVIELAKKYGVPHISYTTNGSLLDYNKIQSLAEAGLDEFIISMHGTSKEVYESMMPGSDFEKFQQLLLNISRVKKEYSSLKLRINYTVNPDNIDDLKSFGDYLENYSIDILQIRPIRKLGNSEYSDFDLKRKQDEYSEIVNSLNEKCRAKNVTSLITSQLPSEKLSRKTLDVANYTYCYVSPEHIGNKDFNIGTTTYRKFLQKNGILRKLIKEIFFTRNRTLDADQNFGNYDVNM